MRSFAIMKRILKEMLRDKRTLALLFLAPLFVLTLINFMFSETSDTKAKMGIYNIDASIETILKSDTLKLKKFDNNDMIPEKIVTYKLDGFLSYDKEKQTYNLTYSNSDIGKRALIASSIQALLTKLKMEQMSTTISQQQKIIDELSKIIESTGSEVPANISKEVSAGQKMKMDSTTSIMTHYIYGNKDTTFFNTLVPLLMAIFVFLFVFLISGIALLKERTTGTLEHLLATPVRRSQIVLGYIGGYGLFALIQTLLIICFVLFVLKIEILGSFFLVLIFTVLLAFIALVIGLFVSTFAHSEFQMVQFIPLIIVPQIFFSGLIPLEGINGLLRGIAHFMPLYYGATALTDIVTKGYGFGEVGWKMGILCLFSILFIIINIWGLKRYRKV